MVRNVNLYCAWFCPYAQRAWMVLKELGVDHKYIEALGRELVICFMCDKLIHHLVNFESSLVPFCTCTYGTYVDPSTNKFSVYVVLNLHILDTFQSWLAMATRRTRGCWRSTPRASCQHWKSSKMKNQNRRSSWSRSW